MKEACEMQTAQTYLEVVRSRGERRLELCRVYRNLKNRELYLMAYGKLYANAGALTPGAEANDTVDGMSLKRIDALIAALEAGTYEWTAVRRVHIPKRNGKLRPLGLPSWTDKLLQEVLRMVLSAYYEPQFSEASHGFRPQRGCHTALQRIQERWTGVKWFIEGDIKGCYDNISHTKLLEVISRKIKDNRFMKLLKGLLEAGYLEAWTQHQTYSGVPQGGVLSPLLMNIYLNELDTYIEETVIPKYTRGRARRWNPEYSRIQTQMKRARQREDKATYRELRQRRNNLPSKLANDEGFRRLKYVRYADDMLLGFIGTRREAKEIKEALKTGLQAIGLEMSEDKTLITHATQERARFLGYEVAMMHCNTKHTHGKRSVNGHPTLHVPVAVVKTSQARYMAHGKPRQRRELMSYSDYDIVMKYSVEFQGLANYYLLASDVSMKMHSVKWRCEQSLVKTLAGKHKKPIRWVYRKYKRINENGLTTLTVEVPREGKKPLIARFGAKPIRTDKRAIIQDTKTRLWTHHSELVTRLLSDQCELCGSKLDIQVHHVRKLREIKQRYKGRPNPPAWAVRLMQIKRKTLIVCAKCHQQIHAGTYDGPKLKKD
jgi:group II intron reverse transcriptase/maturase